MLKWIHIESLVTDSNNDNRQGATVTKSLQQMFIESRGNPVQMGPHRVIQMAQIPVKSGQVTVQFLGEPPTGIHGLRLKSAKGGVTLSDGSVTRCVIVWDEPHLPRQVTHSVECPDRELRVWNVYRVTLQTGEVIEEYWTGNAGMVLVCDQERMRRYKCSAGPGPFDPEQFQFEIRW